MIGAETKPLVSILTPCFNSARFIERCIESVLAQDYPHVEFIVQDGGSTDGTVEILRRYTGRIDWRSEKDAGQSDGLNRALQRCHGDVIGVLNADDEYLPNAASWAVEQLTKNQAIAVVYGRQYNIDNIGNIAGITAELDPYNFTKIFCCEEVIPAQAAFIRRLALEAVGFYVDVTRSTCPDYEMWVRLGLRFPMRHCPTLVAKYYWHAGSEGQNSETVDRMVESKCEIVNRVCRNPNTPIGIRRLRRRAIGGIFRWSVGHYVMIDSKVYRRKIWKQLLKSFFICPRINSSSILLILARLPGVYTNCGFFINLRESLRVMLRWTREIGRFLDKIFLGGLIYRFVYRPAKEPVRKLVLSVLSSKIVVRPLHKADLLISEINFNLNNFIEARRQKRRRKSEHESEWEELQFYMNRPDVREIWSRAMDAGVPYGNGFHGDKHLVSLADFFLKNSKNFVETGTYLGLTSIHVGKNYPLVRVYSCDIDRECVRFARLRTRLFRNIRIDHQSSPEFLRDLLERQPEIKNQWTTYWIDSHWRSYWPLQNEIEFLTRSISKGFIMVDDFKVPGRPEFTYDTYEGRECSMALIKPWLAKEKTYAVIYPRYTQEAARPILQGHNQPVGVCTLVIGFEANFLLPEPLGSYFSVALFRGDKDKILTDAPLSVTHS